MTDTGSDNSKPTFHPALAISNIRIMSIPEDLVIQILVKLPVKLLRFKSVSIMLSIISSSYFIIYHLQSARRVFSLCKPQETVSRIMYFLQLYMEKRHWTLELLKRDCNNTTWSYPLHIVGYCNGLVCVAVHRWDLGVIPGVLMLWNPASKKFHKMPFSGSHKYAFQYGFGYDASDDDYKVVQLNWVCYKHRKLPCPQRIYSLRSNSWKLLDWNVSARDTSCTMGIFVNGAIHWIVTVHDGEFGNPGIIAINLTSETAIFLEAPVDLTGLIRGLEHLCLSYSTHEYTDYWMMQEYGIKDSWTKIMCHRTTPLEFLPDSGIFEVPEYDQGSGKSEEEWKVEKVFHQFNELPLTQVYIKFHTDTYCESLFPFFLVSLSGSSILVWSVW